MFLSLVYKHSKWMFAVMVFFIISQAVININHGAVLTPFYHYGMYSEVLKVKPAYEVITVEVNGKALRGEDFSIQQWDKIYLPIRYYLASDSNNNLMINIRNRMYSRLHIGTLHNNNLSFNNAQLSPQQFMTWYAKYLQGLVDLPVQTINIKQQQYSSHQLFLSPIKADSAKPILPAWNLVTSTVVK